MSETDNLDFLEEPEAGGSEETTPKAQQILDSLTELKSTSLKDSQTLGAMLADPDIRAIMVAKQKGVKVKIQEDTGLASKVETDEPEVALDEMNNTQLAKFLTSNMAKIVDGVLSEKLKGVDERLSGVTQFVATKQQSEAQQQIEATRQKYPDFDDLRPQMIAVVKENGNLNAEEAYLIAKIRSGAKLGSSTQSERPTHSAARPPINRTKNPLAPGKAGWNQLLAEGLARTPIDAPEQ